MNLDMHHLLTLMYGAMGLVALAGYGPQVRALWTQPDLCEKTPLVTWILWSCQTVVFFLYAVIANGDPMFMFNSFMFMCATLGCLALIIRGRKLAEAAKKVLPDNVVRLVA
jgi:hypothetical protein